MFEQEPVEVFDENFFDVSGHIFSLTFTHSFGQHRSRFCVFKSVKHSLSLKVSTISLKPRKTHALSIRMFKLKQSQDIYFDRLIWRIVCLFVCLIVCLID
jgi:hypothetical protein